MTAISVQFFRSFIINEQSPAKVSFLMIELIKSLQTAVEQVDAKRAALANHTRAIASAQAAFDIAQKQLDEAIQTAKSAHDSFNAKIAESLPGTRSGRTI